MVKCGHFSSVCIAGLGEGVEGLKRKRRKERKRPLGMLEDGQMLSQRSMEVCASQCCPSRPMPVH